MTSTDLVVPEAIDAHVLIEAVRVEGRHRQDLGDIAALAASIRDIGLLNPITLTREGRLVAGQRRLEACRRLGWDFVPVRYVDNLDDAITLLLAERDENTQRKDMSPEELLRLGASLEALERPKAKERQRASGPASAAKRDGESTVPLAARGTVDEGERLANETAAIVGDAVGLGRTRYYMAKSIVEHADDPEQPEHVREAAKVAREQMNATGKVTPAYELLKTALKAEPEPEPEGPAPAAPGPLSDHWIPESNEKSRSAVARRRELIQGWAEDGYTSHQMSARLGILAGTVRRIARADNITIRADALVRGAYRPDSNRIVRATVDAVAYIGTGLDEVNFDELDQAEVPGWVDALNDAVRVLTRLRKQLKELVA